ncbi:MAG TPA: phosphotransferase [Gemmatimonadales bacterium]|nr:phosphotransferase [Gemmatimonadales bacterium]
MEACQAHGLTLRQVSVEDVEQHAGSARALLLPIPNESATFSTWSRRVIDQARRHGQLVASVFQTDARPGDMPPEEDIRRYFQTFRRLERQFPIRGFYSNWDVIARELSTIQVEPGANPDLVIDGAAPTDREAELLLRRAFHDFSALHLEPLAGGRSGAEIWRVSGSLADGRPAVLSVVAKISTPAKIAAEKSACLIIESQVPHRLYAPLLKERSLTAIDRAVAAYHFLTRCEPIVDRLAGSGTRLISNLFEYTLSGLHQDGTTTTGQLAREFGLEALKAFRYTEDLNAAAERAIGRGARVPRPTELQQLLDELPKSTFAVGTVHGDPHIGNLFVPTGTDDVVIIDYGSVRKNAPLVADGACLEVSLLFPAVPLPDRAPHPSTTSWVGALVKAYKMPLQPSQARQLEGVVGKGIASVIRRIRERARTLDPNPCSYAIAIAAYLIRFAAFSENGSVDDRSVAYELATTLISDAAIAMHRDLGRRAKPSE